MTAIYEIPLSPMAQKFRIPIGDNTYTLHLSWNQFLQTWIMDVHDETDYPLGALLSPPYPGGGGLEGVPLVTGTDLLGQYRYLGIGGGVPMIVMTVGPGHSPDELPTYDNLGIEGRLYIKTLVKTTVV